MIDITLVSYPLGNGHVPLERLICVLLDLCAFHSERSSEHPISQVIGEQKDTFKSISDS